MREIDGMKGQLIVTAARDMTERRRLNLTAEARKDLVTGAIVVAAIIMFVGTGSSILSSVIKNVAGTGASVDRTLSIAMILNIAIILFGWRRYRELAAMAEERKMSEERAKSLSLRDPLTGFHNRRSLTENGEDLLSKTLRKNRKIALVMFDLDHFKNVNDVHGHAAGDALLRQVAIEMSKFLPPQSLLARLGGDEFACAIPFDDNDQDSVTFTVEKIVRRLSQPFDLDGIIAHVSASAGIAQNGSDCTSIDTLMRHADIAMYASKRGGRNQMAWFDVSMEQELQNRNELEVAMRAGIPEGAFIPYFEQQIDLTTGRLTGFEVLARWDHPIRGLVSPDIFIPMAEETGMIGDLSLSVIGQALSEARSWDPSLTLSVNISPIQLKDPWLAQKMVKLLVETGFPANRLEIEITETSLFENLALAQSIIGSLKNQGILLALDDFGTGYSSLAHLRALPFDRIKIDKSFVTSVIGNAESAAIIKAITSLGDSLNLSVTAEGIESAEIEKSMRTLGCHKGQGWHFGRPASIAATRALLAQRHLLPAYRDEKPVSKEAAPENDVKKTGTNG
jgi:diguanylate cyclase (GGDEF)-like protein